MTPLTLPHPLDDAITFEPQPDGTLLGRTSLAYANMVGPFGGTTAACLLQAPLQHAARLGDPVALTVNFAAPLADGDFRITARPVRTNRTNQHWMIELAQGGEVAATATAVFAARRTTWSAQESTPPAGLPAADAIDRTPPVDRLAWTQRYDMRFAHGGLPEAFDGQEQDDSVSQVWLRDEPPRPLDFVALAALCDCFFPRVILRRRKAILIGTVSMTTYFHADAATLERQGVRHVLGTVRAANFHNSYFDQSAELWSDDRRLLASSHQIVYYRE